MQYMGMVMSALSIDGEIASLSILAWLNMSNNIDVMKTLLTTHDKWAFGRGWKVH